MSIVAIRRSLSFLRRLSTLFSPPLPVVVAAASPKVELSVDIAGITSIIQAATAASPSRPVAASAIFSKASSSTARSINIVKKAPYCNCSSSGKASNSAWFARIPLCAAATSSAPRMLVTNSMFLSQPPSAASKVILSRLAMKDAIASSFSGLSMKPTGILRSPENNVAILASCSDIAMASVSSVPSSPSKLSSNCCLTVSSLMVSATCII